MQRHGTYKCNGYSRHCRHAVAPAGTDPWPFDERHGDTPVLATGRRAQKKRGFHVKPPLDADDGARDQSLKRPRTPTRLLPPRLSLPKLRG